MSKPDLTEGRIREIDQDPSLENAREFLRAHSGERDFEYILCIHELVENVSGIVEVLLELLEDTSCTGEVRFSAFFGLSVFHYKNQNLNSLGELHDEYGSEFEDEAFYEFLYAVYLRERGEQGDLENALNAFDNAVGRYPENPGILKGAANGYLTALETGETVRDEEGLLEDAENCIREAIRIYPDYAEYYADLGRVYKLRGQYGNAEKEFDRAIDLESDQKDNYGVAIARYQYQKALAKLKQLEDQYVGEINDVQTELDNIDRRSDEIARDFQTTVIQSISFFTGIVALVVTFVDVALSFPVQQAAQLVTVLIGGIVIAFGGMTAILPSKISLQRIAILYGTGAILFVAGGIWMVFL